MRRAGILGGGPAAWIAAGVLARAGCAARVYAQGTMAAQASHVHLLPQDLMDVARTLDPDLAARLQRAARPCRWLTQTGTSAHPRLSRRSFQAGVIRWARAKGARRRSAAGVPRPSHAGWSWPDGWRSDLAVDATGGARTLARVRGGAGDTVSLDTVGDSWFALTCAIGPAVGPERLARIRLPAGGLGHLAVDRRGARMSLLSPGALDDWTARAVTLPLVDLAEVRPGAMAWRRMRCPPVRLLRGPATADPPWFAFGDAALQTLPVAGYGLTAALRQGRALAAALAGTADPAAGVAAETEAIWLSAVLALH